MNDDIDKELSMLDRYVELKLNTLRTGESGTVTVTAKLVEDGVELEAWIGNECIGATYTSYAHMGIDVIDAAVFDNE
tara:strand:+ start:242 stop:472 length:231 start_codon:yes stop_codon:yes gene_type:complete